MSAGAQSRARPALLAPGPRRAAPPVGHRVDRQGRLDRAWLVALIAVVAGALAVGARLALLAHWDPSRFVLAGTRYAGGAGRVDHIFVMPGFGYDGQFFYRLALDPARLTRTAFGITLDHSYRAQRIGYPALAWLAAGGHARLVPWSLIAVNVASLGLLGFVSGVLARDCARHAFTGLLLTGFWGFAFSLSRDTAEIPAAAFTLAALLALRRQRPWWAAALFSLAVLTRETSLLVVGAVAVHQLWVRLRRGALVAPGERGRRRAYGGYAAWVVPVAVFAGWQTVVRSASGRLAGAADAGRNLGLPFQAVSTALGRDLATVTTLGSRLDLAELTLFAGLVVLAANSLRSSSIPAPEKLAWLAMGVLVACLAARNLAYQANQRSLDQFYLLTGLVLLGSRRRLLVPGVAVAAMWLAVAAHTVTVV